MKVVKHRGHIIAYDVDGTLVTSKTIPGAMIEVKCNGSSIHLSPIQQHVDQIKREHTRGNYVIVWSQQGGYWAEAVVKALELEPYVDLVMSKPTWTYDDLPISKWLTRLFKDGDNMIVERE